MAAQRERAAVGVVVPARARGGVAGRPKSEQGEEEEEEEGGGGLSLMQLELSEEDLPAVVPYEEVRAAGGKGRGDREGIGGGGSGTLCGWSRGQWRICRGRFRQQGASFPFCCSFFFFFARSPS